MWGLFLCVFEKIFYQRALVRWNLLCPEKFLARPALRHYSFCKKLRFKSLKVFWIRLYLDNCSVICTVALCYILPQRQYPWTLFIQVYSGIIKHILHYSRILRSYQPSHIHHLVIFWALAFRTGCIFKDFWNFDQHIQHSIIVRRVSPSIIQLYSSIFRTLCSACICRNLTYSQSWNI